MALSNIIWKCQCLSLGTQGFYIFYFPTRAPIIPMVHIILLTYFHAFSTGLLSKNPTGISFLPDIPLCIIWKEKLFYSTTLDLLKHHLITKTFVLNNYVNNFHKTYSTKNPNLIVLTNSFFMKVVTFACLFNMTKNCIRISITWYLKPELFVFI